MHWIISARKNSWQSFKKYSHCNNINIINCSRILLRSCVTSHCFPVLQSHHLTPQPCLSGRKPRSPRTTTKPPSSPASTRCPSRGAANPGKANGVKKALVGENANLTVLPSSPEILAPSRWRGRKRPRGESRRWRSPMGQRATTPPHCPSTRAERTARTPWTTRWARLLAPQSHRMEKQWTSMVDLPFKVIQWWHSLCTIQH